MSRVRPIIDGIVALAGRGAELKWDWCASSDICFCTVRGPRAPLRTAAGRTGHEAASKLLLDMWTE